VAEDSGLWRVHRRLSSVLPEALSLWVSGSPSLQFSLKGLTPGLPGEEMKQVYRSQPPPPLQSHAWKVSYRVETDLEIETKICKVEDSNSHHSLLVLSRTL
jgi:hypothetical protein